MSKIKLIAVDTETDHDCKLKEIVKILEKEMKASTKDEKRIDKF